MRKQAKLDIETMKLQESVDMCQEEEDINVQMEDESNVELGEPEKELVDTNKSKKNNTMDISGLAQTALRFEVSNREAAACATVYLGDLIRAGHLPPDATYLAVDPNKIQRARDRIIEEASATAEARN